MAFGTLSSLDALSAVRQSVAEYGEDRAWASIEVALAAHNRQVADMTGSLWEDTTDTQRAYGTGDSKSMVELDQWGLPDAQKIMAGVTVGFPLRRYGNTLQWTRQFILASDTAQLAAEVQAILDADRMNIIRAAKLALFTPTNATFVDKLGNPANVSLAVKALVNNDGANLPSGPNGETFATSHTHYLANATLTAAALTNAVVTVQEHYNTGKPVIIISQTDEAAVRALTGFYAYTDARLLTPFPTTASIPAQRVDVANLYDRAIGLYGPAEVWIKPWAIANYAIVYIDGNGMPPLARRLPTFAGAADLQLLYQDDRHPLYARGYERQLGFGVWNRTAAAILQFNSGTYAAPSIS